jgi:AGCS family alanine or glycine:cation symporter
MDNDGGVVSTGTPPTFAVNNGNPVVANDEDPRLAYYDVPVDRFFIDPEQTQPFSGTIYPAEQRAEDVAGNNYVVLYGDAVRNSSPLTALGFERGLEPIGLGGLGRYIVLICVFMFAISTAISWS